MKKSWLIAGIVLVILVILAVIGYFCCADSAANADPAALGAKIANITKLAVK